jgi:hypothetical protein
MVIMLNLLIAIINAKFAYVKEKKIPFMFRERAIDIAQYQDIFPTSWIQGHVKGEM